LAELEAKVSTQGKLVREAKESNADKAVVDGLVKVFAGVVPFPNSPCMQELLLLKQALAAAGGAPAAADGKKKGKGKP
jgi:hypothetical protein